MACTTLANSVEFSLPNKVETQGYLGLYCQLLLPDLPLKVTGLQQPASAVWQGDTCYSITVLKHVCTIEGLQ